MYEIMAMVEASLFAEALRNLGVWTYGIVNLAHIVGISLLFGAIVILDMRLLSFWQSISVATISTITVPVAAVGLSLAIPSGVSMFAMNATQYHENPFIYLKMPILVVALANVLLVTRLNAWQRAVTGNPLQPRDGSVLYVSGAFSLCLWSCVLVCGRMIGYW
ncbi:MAG: hypothetical protein ACJ0RF_00025 [Luminiphilus sp.]